MSREKKKTVKYYNSGSDARDSKRFLTTTRNLYSTNWICKWAMSKKISNRLCCEKILHKPEYLYLIKINFSIGAYARNANQASPKHPRWYSGIYRIHFVAIFKRNSSNIVQIVVLFLQHARCFFKNKHNSRVKLVLNNWIQNAKNAVCLGKTRNCAFHININSKHFFKKIFIHFSICNVRVSSLHLSILKSSNVEMLWIYVFYSRASHTKSSDTTVEKMRYF